MNKELYVSSTPHETRVALTEDDQLAEIFFERENEYTLAGSIYKGRVTRVLPGMQSAFVDIGLERDAFLYVSDFLEVGGEEGDDEFDDIPAPKTTIDLRPREQTSPAPQPQASPAVDMEEEEDQASEEASVEDETAADDQNGEAENEGEPAIAGEEGADGDGARPWRGRRRRRGGRRGRGEERWERPARSEASPEPSKEIHAKENHSHSENERSSFSPPPGYTPMVLPGESISKYRDRSNQQPASGKVAQPEEQTTTPSAGAWPTENAESDLQPSPSEVGKDTDFKGDGQSSPAEDDRAQHGHVATEPEQLEWAAAGGHHPEDHEEEPAESKAAGPGETTQETSKSADLNHDNTETVFEVAKDDTYEQSEQTESESQRPSDLEATEETESFTENGFSTADFAEEQTASQIQPQEPQVREHALNFPNHEAPSTAPVGRTLEHETLDEEEMEFPPVPEDLEALSEVAADSDLDLVEETLDAENGFGERWVPKIADVDEEEVLAAEMRGETYQPPAEEENGEEYEEEEANDRAEVRAASPTAGYQQRQSERPGYERRGQRGRRSNRRNNVRLRPHSHRPQPLITDLLKEGQEVLVQIAKEPINKKGARITSHIALPGRFLVYMPTVNHVGVSRKISSEEERQRLKRIVTSERENGLGGFIVRTAAANIKEEELRADIRFLKHLWAEIKSRTDTSKAPALIYHDLNLVERVLRDQVNAEFSQIWVDTEEEYERVIRFANRFQPALVRRIKLYTKQTPLFEQFGIQEEIDKSLKSKVWLKSGGYIVINQTEALVAIDINTGKYVGKTQRLEDTIVKTNIEAIREIVRQIRLRDLGGIIVIDFIDMDERKNRQKVMAALEDALRADRAPSKVLQFNDFGLVAITRKRVKQSLERTLGDPCPYCTGAGFVKSPTTICNEIYVEMRKMAKEHDRKDVTLRVNPEVAKALKADNGKLMGELEDLIGKTVIVKGDPLLHQENFDIH